MRSPRATRQRHWLDPVRVWVRTRVRACEARLPAWLGWLGLCGAGVVAAVCVAPAAGTAVWRWVRMPVTPSRIALAPATDEGSPAADAPRARPAAATSVAPTPAAPAVNWREESLVRAAAGYLLRRQEFERALALLRACGRGGDDGLAIETALYRRGQSALPGLISRELKLASGYWQGLSVQARAARLYPQGESEVTLDSLWAGLSADGTTHGSTLPRLPPELSLGVATNVYAALVREAKVPPGCARVLAESVVSGQPLSRFLFGCLAPPESAVPYEETGTMLARGLERECADPLLQTRFAELKEALLRAGNEERHWFGEVLGGAADRLVGFATTERDPRAISELWRELPGWVQALLSQDILAGLGQTYAVGPPQSLAAALPRFTSGLDAAPVATLRTCLCRHPLWRLHLRRFDYDQALQAVPLVLGRLGLSRWANELTPVLSASLQAELRLLAAPEFPWLSLVPRVRAQGPPAFWKAPTEPAQTRSKRQQFTWDLISEQRLYACMKELQQRYPDRVGFQVFVAGTSLFGQNRGLIPAVDRVPPTVPGTPAPPPPP